MARVLVVDDAAFMRKMVTDALTKGGHEVVGEAGNGVEAIDRFQELKPDLTTLDITMPEKDGLTALKEIIELDPGRARDHVLGARPGVQGARVDQARRQGLRRQAVPGRTACSTPSARRCALAPPPAGGAGVKSGCAVDHTGHDPVPVPLEPSDVLDARTQAGRRLRRSVGAVPPRDRGEPVVRRQGERPLGRDAGAHRRPSRAPPSRSGASRRRCAPRRSWRPRFDPAYEAAFEAGVERPATRASAAVEALQRPGRHADLLRGQRRRPRARRGGRRRALPRRPRAAIARPRCARWPPPTRRST